MNLGATIKQCRSLRKMTQSQLADAAGLSVSHLCLLEKNERQPSISTIESIAQTLEIPLSVLVFLAAEKEEVPELTARHIEDLSRHIINLMKLHVQK